MIKLFKKGLCVFLSFAMLAGVQTFSAHASDVYPYKHTAVTGHKKVPVGTKLRFQTPALKKDDELCYTAGNGEVLQTFVAEKPVQNADGTVSYNLGFVCCKEGETGIYINLNGKPFMLYSIQVVDDKSEEGFPLSTSFGKIFASQQVEKIVVSCGNKSRQRQTTDINKINRFMAKLAPEKLYRNCDTSIRVGWNFAVDFYIKGQNGYYSYTLSYGFNKINGFSAPLPTGDCVEENGEEMYNIIGDFYTGLG